MLSSASLRPRLSLTKAATISDFKNISPILNTANWTTGANGVGVTAGASSIALINYGVGGNGKITASIKYTTGTVDIRIMARVLTNTGSDATYYWAGCTGTNFRIGKVVNGTFTTLATTAFTLASDTFCSMTLQVVGSDLTATFDDGTTSGSLSASDGDITTGGVFAIRSGPTNTNCNIWCRSLTVEEAP